MSKNVLSCRPHIFRSNGFKNKSSKILLSAELGNMALIWANKYNLGTEYLSKIYAAGWSNGWQEFDMDNFSNITEILKVLAYPTNSYMF